MLDAKETPERFPQGFRVHLQGLNDWVQKRMGSTLELLFGGVALMLLIGCANVSILLLARGTRRWQELVVSAKAVVLKILVEPGANSPPSCKVAAASLRPIYGHGEERLITLPRAVSSASIREFFAFESSPGGDSTY